MAKEDAKNEAPKNEQVTMTRAELNDLITTAGAAAAKAALESMRGNLGIQTDSQTEEERFAARMGRPIADRTPHKETRVDCLEEDTGMRWTAIVVPSREFPSGRVAGVDHTSLIYPEDIGMRKILGASPPSRWTDKNGQLTPEAKQWRWVNYFQRVLQYVGHAATRLPRAPEPVAASGAATVAA